MADLIKISETIRDHLIKQNAQAIDNGLCCYRTDSGLKCAVGCLITDEHYSSNMEHRPAKDGRVVRAIIESLGIEWNYKVEGLLTAWQAYHDGVYGVWVNDKLCASPSEQHENFVKNLINIG